VASKVIILDTAGLNYFTILRIKGVVQGAFGNGLFQELEKGL